MSAEEGETGEGDIRRDRNREVVLTERLGELERLEDRVGAGHGVEEGGGVGSLGVEGWIGGGDGAVFCVAEDEVLCCEKVSKDKRK